MSIQAITKRGIYAKFYNLILLVGQIIKRFFLGSTPKVFFRYQTKSTHPSFNRFYENSPINWANPINYDLAHWINYPAWINDKPFIVEINDHPLSAVSYKHRGLFEPKEIMQYAFDAKYVYDHEMCAQILLPDERFERYFEHYFGNDLSHKFVRINSPGCMPKRSKVVCADDSSEHGFACLASDYQLKGVDLVLGAWQNIENKNGWRLFLACPNVPQYIAELISSDPSIVLISKAPLSQNEKDQILSQCSVTLAPTHVHGGANVVEGMEYGHAIIHFETHSSCFDSFGSRIDVPYHFYTPSHYGVTWKTFAEFKSVLAGDKQAGLFHEVEESLTNAMLSFMHDENFLCESREISLRNAHEDFSLKNRNQKLITIYHSILN